jgi:hypothetical protein
LHECVALKGSHIDKLGESWVVGVGNAPYGLKKKVGDKVVEEVAIIDFDTDKPEEAKRRLLPE